MAVKAGRRPLALAPGSESVGELGDGEDALAGVGPGLFLLHPSQETDVVLFDRFVAAALAELADGAVDVEEKPRWLSGALHVLNFRQHALSLARFRTESDARGPTILAVPDNPNPRRPTLDAGEKQSVDVQQSPLALAHLPACKEQQWDVMEVPQLRGTRHTFQPVEG